MLKEHTHPGQKFSLPDSPPPLGKRSAGEFTGAQQPPVWGWHFPHYSQFEFGLRGDSSSLPSTNCVVIGFKSSSLNRYRKKRLFWRPSWRSDQQLDVVRISHRLALLIKLIFKRWMANPVLWEWEWYPSPNSVITQEQPHQNVDYLSDFWTKTMMKVRKHWQENAFPNFQCMFVMHDDYRNVRQPWQKDCDTWELVLGI